LIRVKVHRKEGEVIVAICDEELLGREFREGRFVLRVEEGFYGGDLMTLEEGINQIGKCTIANLVGERIVRAAIEAGYVREENVLIIGGVPHAQLVRI